MTFCKYENVDFLLVFTADLGIWGGQKLIKNGCKKFDFLSKIKRAKKQKKYDFWSILGSKMNPLWGTLA